MKVEFAQVRAVGDCVFADHPTLPAIDVTRYLTRESVEKMLEAEAERQREERREHLRKCAREIQAEALYIPVDSVDESLAMLGRIVQ